MKKKNRIVLSKRFLAIILIFAMLPGNLPLPFASGNMVVKAEEVILSSGDVITAKDKDEAGVTINNGKDKTVTYGEVDFFLYWSVSNPGYGKELLKWTSSEPSVAEIVEDTGMVTIKKAGKTTIKAVYESDNTMGEAEITLTVEPKILGIIWNNTSFTYDKKTHVPTAELLGIVHGDDCTVNVTGAKTDAGIDYTATALLCGEDKDNYFLGEYSNTCNFLINKATPYIKRLPTGSAITYGDKLSASVLLGGDATYSSNNDELVAGIFSWKDGTVGPVVSDSGTTTFPIVFIPSDTGNYNTAESAIKITVNKCDTTPNTPEEAYEVDYLVKKAGDIALDCDWSCSDEDQELVVGENTVTVIYTGSDKGNYELESLEITVTRKACTHPSTKIVKENIVAATCMKDGSYDEVVRCAQCGEEICRETKTELMSGHIYGTPIYTWSSDNKTCTATVFCMNEGCTEAVEGHKVTETVNTTSVVKTDSTTEKKGITTYTATFTNKLFENQSKDVEDIALKAKPEPPTPTPVTPTPAPSVVEKGEEITIEKKGKFEVTSDSESNNKTVKFIAVANKKAKTVVIPDSVNIKGTDYVVTEVAAKAFEGSSARSVTLGKNILRLAPSAFKGIKSKKLTITVKTKKLTKKSVKNAFKGLKIKKLIVKIKVGSKKENKKYIKKYKKFFTKKNIGVKTVLK